MNDPAKHMLILCPACDFVWSAATLPLDMSVAANVLKDAKCPKCGNLSHKLYCVGGKARAEQWSRENR